MDGNQDRSESYATYEGEFESFPARVSYWSNDYLVVPGWFSTQEKAMEYINGLGKETRAYSIVQEKHFPEGDLRIAEARIVGSLICKHQIQPEEIVRAGCTIRTMYLVDELALQYLDSFNEDVKAARKKGA
jgi:hypothetical protein